MSEKIIAVSAGREITETEFNEFLSKLPEQQQAYVATEEGRKQALTQYANYFLFEKLEYDGYPVINGRGFEIKADSREKVVNFLREYATRDDENKFFEKWLNFNTYRKVTVK